MKKRVTLLMMAMLMVLTILAGCSSKGSKPAADDPIIGTWEIKTIEMEGVSLDFKEFAAQLGEGEEAVEFFIAFTADGKFNMAAMEEKAEGTWTAKGDGKYETSTDGVKEELAITDGKIVIEDEEIKMVFEKKQ